MTVPLANRWESAGLTFPDAPSERSERLKPLTLRAPGEILAMKFDSKDFLLGNGYLIKGNSLGIVGTGGLGKSRIVMQMAIACITGRPFFGWETHATGQNWLILQTENSNRRLQSDLSAMLECRLC